MNVADLIARAKALYMVITDPTAGYFKKLRAIGEFLTVILPLFGGDQPMFAVEPGMTAQKAMADLESLNKNEGMGSAPLEANGEWIKKILALLSSLWPLVFQSK